MPVIKHWLLAAAAIVAAGIALLVVGALQDKTVSYRFEGYDRTVTTRLAVLAVTNLQSCAIDLIGRAKVEFADGWNPIWGNFVLVGSTPTIAGGKSAKWLFEVPPHKAKWKISFMLVKHSRWESAALQLSQYRLLGWTLFFTKPRKIVFSSDWQGE